MPDKFCIYLRAFDNDDTEIIEFSLFKTFNFEHAIQDEIYRCLQLRCITVMDQRRKEHQLGGDKLFLNHLTWKEDIIELFIRSEVILIKPSFSDGLQWELEQIINKRLLFKTIFLTHVGSDKVLEIEEYRFNEFFTRFCSDYNLIIPKYLKRKRYICFENNFPNQYNILRKIPIISKIRSLNRLN